MIGFANAKLNLGLHIISKRKDGYHDIETIFYPLYELRDVVEVVPSSSIDIVQTGFALDIPMKDNLVYKAYNLLAQEYDLSPVMFFLHKVIPFGAGLGGGSSDAAQVLLLLNKIFDLQLSTEKLMQYAVRLGADCAFFINNTPMLASGIGDIMNPIEIDLSQYNIVVVKPDLNISTKYAYSIVKPIDHKKSLKELIDLPIEEWKSNIKNDFEQFLFPIYPQLEEIHDLLYRMGALYVSLSGSGSAFYAIFDNIIDLDYLRNKFSFVWQSKK